MFAEGFLKVAAGLGLSLTKAPKEPLRGLHGAPRALNKPARVTPSVRPGNAVAGINGLTGAPAIEPFGKPIGGGFGKFHRKGIVSRTAVGGGVRG